MEISSGAEEGLTVDTWEAPAYMSCKHQLQLDGERRCNDCPQPQHPAKHPPTRHPLTLLILQHHPHPTLAPEVNLHLPGRKILLHLSRRNKEMWCLKDPICSPACSNMLVQPKKFQRIQMGLSLHKDHYCWGEIIFTHISILSQNVFPHFCFLNTVSLLGWVNKRRNSLEGREETIKAGEDPRGSHHTSNWQSGLSKIDSAYR